MRTLPCSLGKWVKCFTREDKATSEEVDIKGDLKRRKRWSFLARRQAI